MTVGGRGDEKGNRRGRVGVLGVEVVKVGEGANISANISSSTFALSAF
jgi:hypothetical protein